MEDREESCELQQLVPSDADGDGDDTTQYEMETNEQKPISSTSPVVSNKISSLGENSQGSLNHSSLHSNFGTSYGSSNPISSSSRLIYVNEKRLNREPKPSLPKVKNEHKEKRFRHEIRHHCFLTEVPDVRNMERALIGLLADFHSGKLRAFGKGCSMEQMTDIREQQERLARLHFDLGAGVGTTDPPLSVEGLRYSHNTMTQLVQRLEQLSVSIEQLHSSEP